MFLPNIVQPEYSMRSHSLTINGGWIAAKLRIDPNEIYAGGALGSAGLIVRAHLEGIFPFKDSAKALEFRACECKVSAFEKGYIATSRLAAVRMRLSSERKEGECDIEIEIPLDRERLAFLERERKGKDVHLSLTMEISANELMSLGNTREEFPQPVWGLLQRHLLREQVKVTIPQSRWIDTILPHTGLGTVYVLELPRIGSEQSIPMTKSVEALAQALEFQKQGFFDEAVGKCRIALEPFFQLTDVAGKDGTKRPVPVLTPSWETKLGKATYVWLNECFVGLKKPTNYPHHNTNSLFDTLETQLLINVTASLIAYAVNAGAVESTS